MLHSVRWLFAQTFQPVVDPAQHDVRGEERGDRAVFELHVHQGEIIDVEIVFAEMARVAKGRKAGDGVRACGYRLGTDGPAAPRAALDPFQVQRRGERVAAFADQNAAAAPLGIGVIDRMGAAMGLLAVDPEDLPAGLLEDLALFLDRRRNRSSSRRTAAAPCSCVPPPAPARRWPKRWTGPPVCRPDPSGSSGVPSPK